MSIKYSIIIPVYNVEKYLDDCLSSILNQTYKNYEVILINDGSSDNSSLICKKYCDLSKSFKLIEQVNGGVSSARNNGIRNASGDYLLFIDSDDYIDNNSLEIIDNYICDNDLLIFGYEKVFMNKSIKRLDDSMISDFNTIKQKIITSCLGGFLCNKVYKRDIIINNNLYLDDNMYYCEDLLFNINYLKFCNKSLYLGIDLYKYRMRKSGASMSFYKAKNVSIFKAYNEALLFFHNDSECVEFLKKMYLFNYYRLKKFIVNDNYFIDYNYIANEKDIIKNASYSWQLRIIMCKYCLPVYKFIQKIKQIGLKLYS